MKELHDLHAFVDGELSPEEARAIRVWIASDPTAQAEWSAISNLKDCLKEKSSKHSAEDCWKVCVKRLNELERSRHVETFVGKYAWAMCIILFALVIGGRYAVAGNKGEVVQAADFGLFHSSSQSPSPEVKKLFGQIMAQAHRNRAEVRLLSQTSGMIKDQPVDRFVFSDQMGELAYYVIKNPLSLEDASQVSVGLSGGTIPGADPTGTGPEPRSSYVIWVDGDQTNVLIGPRSVEDLSRAARDLGLRTSVN
jgi:hypothetical protein